MMQHLFPIKAVCVLAVFSAGFACIFSAWPGIDMAVSRLFYEEGQGFYLQYDPDIYSVYKGVSYITRGVVGVMVLLFLLRLCERYEKWPFTKIFFPRARYSALLYLLAALVMGPWLGVHHGVKEIFERPRPRDVVEFAGESAYVPPLVIGEEDGNSFVSGHASIGFYVAAIALLLTGWQRITLYLLAIVAGGMSGFIRVMQGGHFVSDIVYSGIFTLLVVHLCYAYIYRRHELEKQA